MAVVRILDNSINPRGWSRGDEVEITREQGLYDLRDKGAVDVVKYTPEELEDMKPKKVEKPLEIPIRKRVK